MLKPILFNTQMVQATIVHEKCQTRRAVKFPKSLQKCLLPDGNFSIEYLGHDIVVPGFEPNCENFLFGKDLYIDLKCPYQKGDVLYVRETWAEWEGGYVYRADGTNSTYPLAFVDKWRPSLHMPKEAARLFLEVQNVKIEQLQDIDEKGAKLEGANFHLTNPGFTVDKEERIRRSAVDRFKEIWDRTLDSSKKEIYGWSANPWVWVITFTTLANFDPEWE